MAGAYFYPGTAECAAILAAYPFVGPGGFTCPLAPGNTMGGYGGKLDLSDYDGSVQGSVNLFVEPAAATNSAGIPDLMTNFQTMNQAYNTPGSWFLYRQVEFKDWVGLTGVFQRPASFDIEIDIQVLSMPNGGYRDEAPDQAFAGAGANGAVSPYGDGAPQGAGVMLEAVITDQVSLLPVVKSSHVFKAQDGAFPPNINLNWPRQVVKLTTGTLTPAEIATLSLRVRTQQWAQAVSSSNPSGSIYAHADVSSVIRRIGVLAQQESLRSSGKQSAALTSA